MPDPVLIPLTPEEGDLIVSAFKLMEQLVGRLAAAGQDDSLGDSNYPGHHYRHWIGMLAGRAETIADLLFAFANTASAYGHSPVAARATEEIISRHDAAQEVSA